MRKQLVIGTLCGLLLLVAGCESRGAAEAVPVEIGLDPTEPAQVMQADTATPEEVKIATQTPVVVEDTPVPGEIGPFVEVSNLLGFEFPLPGSSTVEVVEEDSLVVARTPYSIEEATGIVEGTLPANGYELVNQVGSAEEELIYTYQEGERIVTITVSPTEDGSGTTLQFAAE